MGTAETAETAARARDRSADEGNILIESVRLKLAKKETVRHSSEDELDE